MSVWGGCHVPIYDVYLPPPPPKRFAFFYYCAFVLRISGWSDKHTPIMRKREELWSRECDFSRLVPAYKKISLRGFNCTRKEGLGMWGIIGIQKEKLGVTRHVSEITDLRFKKTSIHCFVF